MGYVLKAVLSSAQHPEYGQITVPFPIPDEKYDRMIELLEPLEIGDALRQDCRVDELDSFYTVLNRLVGSLVNFDELDYLAKRLDSFDDGEAAQFQGMACKLGVSNIKDFINLTFCCQQATVITDFSDLDAIGRQHYMTMQGGGCRIEELERLDGRKFALDLILNHLEGRITPYGVVYDNGMKLEQLYDGRHFPCYHYQPNLLAVADRIWAKVRKAAALFEEYVQTGKIVWKRVRPAPKIPLTPYYQELLCSFCQHEANTRAIGFESLRDEENVCRKFFAYLDASGYHTCQDINLVNVNDFLLFIASQRKSSMDRVRNTLKHLSAYLVSIQNCCDFSAVLTTRPAPRKKLRPAFSSKEVHTVMDAAAKNPSLSLRDTAIFAVAASLGLRAGDIVRLTLSDIDWIHHEIRFVQNKTGVELHLPLEASVGNAIANYILHERPKTQSPALFVRSRIPFDFMTSTAAGDRLRKYMKLSDVDYTPGDGKGFHSFRRYVASSMINQEVPIDIVKEILGHTQIGSMKAYMRISRDKLAMCALGLDGIEVIQEALL